MTLEILRFIFYSTLIVIISKYVLVKYLRNLAKSLNLKAKTVGDIAGYATSVPELLTITTSSLRGFLGASIYNIISSNIINLIQYLSTIILNKNTKKLNNRAIKLDIVLVVFTILIPIILLRMNINIDIYIVPLFAILYSLFLFLNNNVHKIYLEKEKEKDINLKNERNIKETIKSILILLLTGIVLYIISNHLGNSLENLCNIFNIPEFIIGVLLGFITSIPELITFFEAQKHYKKEDNEMLGIIEATNNLLTSNIMNLFVIQTIGILIINVT